MLFSITKTSSRGMMVVVVVLVLLQLTSCLPSDSPSNPLWPSPPSEEPPSLSSTSSSSIQRAHRLLNAQYNINTPPNSESTSDGRGDDLAAAVVFEPPHHQQQHQPSRSLSSFSELPIPERKLIPLPVLSSPSSSSSAIDSNRPGISTQLKQAVGLNNHNNNYISLSAKLRTIPEASPSMESSRHASFSFEHNKEQYPGYVLDGMEKMITNQDERPVFTDSDTSFMSDYELDHTSSSSWHIPLPPQPPHPPRRKVLQPLQEDESGGTGTPRVLFRDSGDDMYYSSSPDVSLEYESDDAVSKLAQLRAAIKDMKLTGSTESSRFHDDGDDDNEASMFVTTGSSPQSPRRHRHISEESHLSMKSTASTESIAEVYSNLMDGKGYRTVYTPSASPILSGRSTPHRSHSRAASSSANSSPYSPMKSTISLQQPQQQTLTLDTSRLAKSSSDSFDGNDHQNDSLISPRPVAAVLNMKPFFGEETDDNDDEEYRNDGGLNDQSSPPSSLLGISFRPFSEMEDQVFKSDRSSHSSIKFPGPSPKSSSSSPPPRRRKYNKQHIRRISAPPRAIEFDFDSWAEKMGHYFPEEVQENLKRDAAIKDLPSPGQVLKQHFEKEAKILQFPLLYDTKVAHARGEWFSPDRSEFHENLINAWLGGHHESNAASSSTSSSSKYDTKTPLPGQRPFLILMGGAPGAGKSSTLSYLHHKKLINNHNYVYINTDWIRLEILEYKIWTSEEMQPPFRSEEEYDEYLEMMYIKLKREVDYITMQIYSRAISAGKNIVRDGTLRNTGFYSKLLSDPELDQRNYVKGIIHVDVKDEVARERVINRGGLVLNIIPVNDDKEVRSRIEIRGQKITESYFNESGPAQITEAIGLLKPLVDFYVRIDNNSPRFTSLRVQECSVKSSASSTHLALVQSSKRRIVRRSNIGGGRRVRSGSSENIVEKELILDHDEDSGFVPSSLVEDEAGAMNGSDSEVESILEDYDVLDVDTAEQLKKEYGIGFAPSPSFWNQKEARDAKFRKCLNKAGLMFL